MTVAMKHKTRRNHTDKQQVVNLFDTARDANEKVRKDFDPSTVRALYLATVLGIWHTLIGLGKVISGVLGMSIFVCVNGLYTVGMGASRLITATGAVRAGSGSSRRYARIAGIMLTTASVCYVIYASWALFYPSMRNYPRTAAFAIVVFTFVEIGLNVMHLIQTRGAKTAIEKALRIISLASSLIALSLTQEAILSVLGIGHNPTVDACIRCMAGLIAVALGVSIVVRTRSGAPVAKGWK